ncbi:MAG: CpsD/CapB family tyrosine-protein kinase [Candidatus Rokubacteria bacterium]|nr:CpsD/CapB family tyrosine-protein kinase [Candidatus Rokubacteria bacterium]
MKKKPAKTETLPLITEADPKSTAAEAYRALRTNLQFAGLDTPCRSLVVTSAIAGEGKTTTAANLAIVAAQVGTSVCLIEGDLRRPNLHRLFSLPNNEGVTTALVQGRPFAELAQATRVPNLFVLPSGPLPANPAELVASRRMRAFIEAATEKFELVVFDTPPVLAASDAVALSAQCDGTIIVVKAGGAPHEAVRHAVEQIHAVKGRVLGVLLNRLDVRKTGYYSSYYRYYQNYYGQTKP